MNIFDIIGCVLWIWGAYEGWKTLTAKNIEWLNTKEPLNIVVKVALCIVLGFAFAALKIIKLAWHIVSHIPF